MGRGRLDTAGIAQEINETLVENWDRGRCGVPLAPEVRMTQVGDQRIWSGLSASDKLRAHLETRDVMRSEDAAQPRGFSIFNAQQERAVA